MFSSLLAVLQLNTDQSHFKPESWNSLTLVDNDHYIDHDPDYYIDHDPDFSNTHSHDQQFCPIAISFQCLARKSLIIL